MNNRFNRKSPLRWGFYMGFDKNYTGGPKAVISLLSQIDRQVIEPFLVSERESPMTDDAQALGVPVEICPLPSSLGFRNEAALRESWWKKLNNARKLREYNQHIGSILEKRKCDGLWARNVRGVLLTGTAAKKLGLPLVWDIGMEKKVEGVLKSLLFFRALQLADKVVTQGPSVVSQVFPAWQRKIFDRKFKVIRTGVSNKRVEALTSATQQQIQPRREFTIISTATLTPRKNQLQLLKAIQLLKTKIEKLSVLLVGPSTDDHYANKLRKFVVEQRLESIVKFLGWRNDVPMLYAKSDIMVLCSMNEGVPQAILEAIHAGLPVIGTRRGGIPDVITDGKTGLLVDIGNYQQLSDRIYKLYKSPEIRKSLASNALKYVREHHTVKQWAQNYENLIVEVAKNFGKGSFNEP